MKLVGGKMSGRLAAVWTLSSLLSLPIQVVADVEGPFRVLYPEGSKPHRAVLLVPGCSGFTATNGINLFRNVQQN